MIKDLWDDEDLNEDGEPIADDYKEIQVIRILKAKEDGEARRQGKTVDPPKMEQVPYKKGSPKHPPKADDWTPFDD